MAPWGAWFLPGRPRVEYDWGMTDQKKIILDFIKKHSLAVISTVDPEGNPESAVLEFSETDNLELIVAEGKKIR